MSEPKSPADDPAEIDERLVAYLDRELSDAECEEIEHRLAQDANLRDRVSDFDRVWNALDEAPLTTTDRGFAKTTVGVVIEDAEKLSAERLRRTPWKRLIAGLAAFAIGFVVVRGVSSRSDRRLIAELPVIRYAAVLGQADNEEYVRRILREAPEVVSSVEALELRSEADLWRVIADASLPERSEWLESRTESEHQELVDRAIAFRAQAPARSRRLAELDRRIGQSEDAQQLRLAALSHHALLSVLPAGERASFLSKPPEDRVALLRREAKRWSLKALMVLADDELTIFREAVIDLASEDSVVNAIDRLDGFATRLSDRRGPPRGPPNIVRDRFVRSVAEATKRFRAHPEQFLLTVARQQARGERSRWREAFPNIPSMREDWSNWEHRLMAALPPRARSVVGAEDTSRQRARLLLEPLERVAAPARPGEISRFVAEELSNRELQDYLAMPAAEMQERLRDRMAEEGFGGSPPGGWERSRDRYQRDPRVLRKDLDGRRGGPALGRPQ